MKISRNTKLYKSVIVDKNGKQVDVIYRDLTTLEARYIQNIKSNEKKSEVAFSLASENSIDDFAWPTIMQIGELIIAKTMAIVQDSDLFEITVREFRDNIAGDSTLNMVSHITKVFPGTSVIDLLNLTSKDLIELVCLCEITTNKRIFEVQGLTAQNLVKKNGKAEFPDDGQTLDEKVSEMRKFG